MSVSENFTMSQTLLTFLRRTKPATKSQEISVWTQTFFKWPWLCYHAINLCITLFLSCCFYTPTHYTIKNFRRNIWGKRSKAPFWYVSPTLH